MQGAVVAKRRLPVCFCCSGADLFLSMRAADQRGRDLVAEVR